MKTLRFSDYRPWTLALCVAGAISTAQAVNGPSGSSLTLTPNAYETLMELQWVMPDDFAPLPPPGTPCNQLYNYSVSVDLDGTPISQLTFNNQNSTMYRESSAGGKCVLRKTIQSGVVYSDTITPGVWRAVGSVNNQPALVETRSIAACTAVQGKTPMYWTSYAPLTDNFYTTSVSDRNIAINLGHSYLGVPFSMPNPGQFDSARFFRFYKYAPQYEHFYTSDSYERQIVEQYGYTYEGIEGWLFTKAKPGTVQLYRYAYFNPANGDLQHLYSLSATGPLGQPGWTSDGGVGWVCPP
jgi:hypothetical protein